MLSPFPFLSPGTSLCHLGSKGSDPNLPPLPTKVCLLLAAGATGLQASFPLVGCTQSQAGPPCLPVKAGLFPLSAPFPGRLCGEAASFAGLWVVVRLEQPASVVAHRGSSTILLCVASTKVNYIYWYWHEEGKASERHPHMAIFKWDVRWESVLKVEKVTAMEAKDDTSCILWVLQLEKQDVGLYLGAAWDVHRSAGRPGPSQKTWTSELTRPGNFPYLWVPCVAPGHPAVSRTLPDTPSAVPCR